MCLVIDTTGARIADESIKVYKVISDSDQAPFKGTKYIHGLNVAEESRTLYEKDASGKYEFKTVRAKVSLDKPADDDAAILGDGFLHAYTELEPAAAMKRILETSEWNDLLTGPAKPTYKVVEMEVPKGTVYYLNYPGNEIASRALLWK